MRDLLKQEPSLIHASWDWGAGDYESALQAARLDLFAACMLCELAYLE